MKLIRIIKKRALLFSSIGMFLVILCISICYASLNTEMMINGEAYVRVEEDIRVIGIKMLSVENEAYETYNSKYTKNSTNMYATLPNKDSTITYQVTIKNKSSDVYIISEITDELTNSDITYTVDDYKIGQAIPKESTITINITFKYSSSTLQPNITAQIATINYKFEKPYAMQLEFDNSNVDTTCTDVQCALDELYGKF